MRHLDLTGHRALVCGASKGIGREIAKAFAQAGAELVLVARSESALKSLQQELPNSENHRVLPVDLGDYAGLAERVNSVVSSKPITLLVNNAGGPPAGPLAEAGLDQLLKAFEIHILGSQVLMQSLLPGMKAKKYGRIINVISTSVKIPIPNLGVSNTIRGAMASWAKTLAHELGPFGITVNNILPGYTATERLNSLKEANAKRSNTDVEAVEKAWLASIPVGRFADPSETASAALFLASPLASYINGINLPVDGGRTGAL